MEESDVEPLLGVFGDPAVMAAFETVPFDRTQMERWIRRNLAHQTAHGYGLCTVVHRVSGLVVGDCGLEHTLVEGIPEIELGYDIRSDHWNQGFATEAATAVRDHAMDILGVRRLVSLIRAGNGASCRVAEKIGMHRAEEITRHERRYLVYRFFRNAER
jgi:RimJ/RimL family protein N-acetyltransferase